MSDRKDHINYTLADIEDYLQGRLSPAEMHAMEKAALQDPFLADALEGFRLVDAGTARKDIDAIEAGLSGTKDRSVLLIPPSRRTGWWRIAASVILLVGASAVGYYIFKKDRDTKELAVKTAPLAKDTPVVLQQQAVSPHLTDNKPVEKKHEAKKTSNTVAASADSLKQAAELLAELKNQQAARQERAELSMAERETVMAANQPRVSDLIKNDTTEKKIPIPFGATAKLRGSARGMSADSNAKRTRDKQVDITIGKGLVTNKTIPDSNSATLNEVAVMSYNTAQKRDVTGAVMTSPKPINDAIRPAIGWAALFTYMDSSVQKYRGQRKYRYTDKAPPLRKAMLELTLDGSGKPEKVTILDRFDHYGDVPPLDRLKIDALKNGPVWLNTDGSPATGIKKVLIHFISEENP